MLVECITVTPKQTVQADCVFDAPRGRQSAHEIDENPHFGLGAMGKTLDMRPRLEFETS